MEWWAGVCRPFNRWIERQVTDLVKADGLSWNKMGGACADTAELAVSGALKQREETRAGVGGGWRKKERYPPTRPFLQAFSEPSSPAEQHAAQGGGHAAQGFPD